MGTKVKPVQHYIYFEADEGGFAGYFTDFPQHMTDGETIEELEEMLTDMYECLNFSKYRVRSIVKTLSPVFDEPS